MELLSEIDQARRWVEDARRQELRVGIVPTMGALHAGHLSLIRAARQNCDRSVATIFVNPTQFGPGEDLQRYPRMLDEDLRRLESEGVTAVFVPAVNAIYPEGFTTYVEPPDVAKPLEGICRPGHFRGVCTVVLKLFSVLPGTHAFFGRKDYQQLRVIEAMVRDLGLGIEIVPCETVREPDGLAMSSRNRYLTPDERRRALLLWHALEATGKAVAAGETDVMTLESQMRRCLTSEGTASDPAVDRVDYARIVDARTLVQIERIDRDAVALLAAWVGGTRLIDNIELAVATDRG